MKLPVETTFDDLNIYIRKADIGTCTNENVDYLTEKDNYVAVLHSILMHHTATLNKNITGDLHVSFKNINKDSKLYLKCFFQSISASGQIKPDSEMFCRLVKFAYSFVSSYIEENNIKDENNTLLSIPDFKFTKDDFKSNFPDE